MAPATWTSCSGSTANFFVMLGRFFIRLAEYGRQSGAPLLTRDPEELIASDEINTIYICTPTFNHKELALKTLAAGKALFCEKPLAFNAADAAVMRDAAIAAGVTHQVGLVMRYSAVMNVLPPLSPSHSRPPENPNSALAATSVCTRACVRCGLLPEVPNWLLKVRS